MKHRPGLCRIWPGAFAHAKNKIALAMGLTLPAAHAAELELRLQLPPPQLDGGMLLMNALKGRRSARQKRADRPSITSPCVMASPLMETTHPPEQNIPPLLLTNVP